MVPAALKDCTALVQLQVDDGLLPTESWARTHEGLQLNVPRGQAKMNQKPAPEPALVPAAPSTGAACNTVGRDCNARAMGASGGSSSAPSSSSAMFGGPEALTLVEEGRDSSLRSSCASLTTADKSKTSGASKTSGGLESWSEAPTMVEEGEISTTVRRVSAQL